MDEEAAGPGSGAIPPRPRPAIRVALGVVLAAYYLHVLVAVARHFPENLHVRGKVEYAAPWLPRLPHWVASPGPGALLTGLAWLVMVALVIGGAAMVANHKRGMQIGLVALGVSLAEDILVGLPTTVAMAMGWLRVSFTSPHELAQVSAHARDLPPSAMRLAGEAVLAMTLLGIAVKFGIFTWLRRHLARTRPTSAA